MPQIRKTKTKEPIMIFFAHLHYLVPFIWIGIFFYLLLPAMFFFAKDTFRNQYSYELKNINIHTTTEHCTAVMQMSKKMDCLVPYYSVSNLCTSIAPCGFIGHQALGCESSASATLLPEHTTASNINHFQGHRMASHRP